MSDNNLSQTSDLVRWHQEGLRVLEKNGFKISKKWLLMENLRRPGFWLPEGIKKHLRPYKQLIRQMSLRTLYPDDKAQDYRTDINPYWFKEKINAS